MLNPNAGISSFGLRGNGSTSKRMCSNKKKGVSGTEPSRGDSVLNQFNSTTDH